MSRKSNPPPPLSPAQREVMEIFWERGELTASVVRTLLSGQRCLARNTIRTMLERMEEKGWLTHRAEGRTFFYAAAHPRQATIGQKVLDVLDHVCGGSPETLVAALIDFRGLERGELEKVRKLLDKAKARKGIKRAQ